MRSTCAVLVLNAAVGAGVVAAEPTDEARPHEQSTTGPWVLPAHVSALTPVRPGKVVVRGRYVSVQVNIDALGENIQGDAANEPSIAVDPTAPNRIVVGWRQFDSIASNFRQAGWGYSHDGGLTWAFPGVIEPGVNRSDPVLGVTSDGVFYYYSLSFVDDPYDYFMHRSEDAGLSWSDGVYAYGGDKGWFAIDDTGGVGDGHIYSYWSDGQGESFSRSTDRGRSFEQPTVLSPDVTNGTLDVGPDGELYVFGMGGEEVLFILRSWNAQNAGDSVAFDLVREVGLGGRPGAGGGPNPHGLLAQAWLATDHSQGPTRGNVYIMSPIGLFLSEDPLDIMFARSEDRGATWSPPVRINDDADDSGAWQWFGAMSVAPNGRIDVVWYDTRNSGQANISELYYSYSIDAGETWAENVAVSPPFDSHSGWPDQNKIGDYIGCVSDCTGVDVIYSATFNGEQDVYYLRIGPRDCNGNGLDDGTDIASGFSDDCNANGIPDECELAAGTATDGNGNGILDECEFDCPGDVDGDLDVDQSDLGLLLVSYERLPDDPFFDPRADFDGDGDVDQQDLGVLLANYETVCD
jgi:hypothetical protein